MPRSDAPNEGSRRDWASYGLAAAVGVVGLLMMHHPMIFSGLRLVQVDLGDSRLINYFLEHNYLWYLGAPGHERFWDPPFFYPGPNAAAYSDTMLGIAPLYAAFRVVGFAPDTSFQIWTIALSALNYAVMLHFLTRRTGLSVAAASIGAFLFAFGSPRVNMLAQQTQMTQFLSLISVDVLYGLFSGGLTGRFSRAAAWIVAATGILAQLSSAYYPGWFMVLSLGIVSLLAIWMPSTRWPFLATLRRDAVWIALAAVLFGLAIRPWLAHHLIAARELGPRWWQFVTKALPRPMYWFDVGPNNWLGTYSASLTGFEGFRSSGRMIPLGVGLTTTAAVLAGLYLGRHRASTRLLTTAAVVLILCHTVLPESLVIASKSLLILGTLTLAFQVRKEHPRMFLTVVGLVLPLLLLRGMVGQVLLGYGLFALLIAGVAFVGWEGDRRERIMLCGLILGFVWFLFPSPFVSALGLAFGGLLAGLAVYLGRRSRRWIEGMVLGGFLAFVIPITFLEQPTVWLVALGAPVAVLAARRMPIRLSARSLPHLMLIGAAIEILFVEGGSAWSFFYTHVPGASSMMFVYRIGLILLIPAAVGLGYSIDALRTRGRTALAVGLGLICLLEQGASTPAFDKSANREVIGSLARRIDKRSETFYYTPDEVMPSYQANLDAMWAGLERGKPTINGYSGHTPKGWRTLDEPPGIGPADLRKLVLDLDHWKSTFGRAIEGVQWIGGPEDRPERFPKKGAKDEGQDKTPLAPLPLGTDRPPDR